MEMLVKFCLVLLLAACGIAQNKDNADYWQDLYDSQWYDEEIEKLGLDSTEWGDLKDIDDQQLSNQNVAVDELGHDEKDDGEDLSDFNVAEQNDQSKENKTAGNILNQDTENFIPQNEPQPEINNDENFVDINNPENTNGNDYILEDNRFISEEKASLEENLTDKESKKLDTDLVDTIEDNERNNKHDKMDDYVIEDSRLLDKDDIENFNELLDLNEKNIDIEKTEDENENQIESKSQQKESAEFRTINKNEDESVVGNSEVDMDKDKSLQEVENEMSTKQEIIEENQKIVEETKQLLENLDSNFRNSDEDDVDKIYDDLDYDLNHLFDTFNKLSQDIQEESQKQLSELDKPEIVHEDIADYEEKYGRPYREGSILKTRQDYEDYIKDHDDWQDYQSSNENQQKGDSNLSDGEQDDLNIDEILKKLDEELEQDADDALVRDQKVYENDALHANEESNESSESIKKQEVEHPDNEENRIDDVIDQLSENNKELEPNPVEELTSAELKFKTDELVNTYADELDVNADGFDRNVAPVHITLKLDETVEITSPDYPNLYPTNNIIDWIFEGEGMGIELNITDLSLNGFLGDYLLIKPGGIDHTGQDGLVFSFHLNSERRYRFLDVNRMFIRFRAHPGMQFARGFKFSVKMVGSTLTLPEPIPTPTPEPELPEETLTVFFEGLIVDEFRNRSEEFRSIIADMATLYINKHGVEPGYEPTINVTQITRIVECNINWPGHEPCAAVTFGVPLEYSDDQDYRLTKDELEYMWFSYSYIDPYAARLRRMGISKFAIPNEGTVMMAWLVIFLGVFISALMLGFAIWRWNCFEGYSRMPLYTDTDSIISDKKKDDLDLYPTPHQNLPPLYSDGHFEDKWTRNVNAQYENTSRVDLGGYSNKSYVLDNELVDIDSDDDVIMSLPGQRSSRNDGLTITSKHVFEV